MNNNLGAGIFFMIAFLMVFAPLMCGIVDVAAIFFIDHTVLISWTQNKIAGSVLWVFFGMFLLGGVG